jgi:hypothetical protein
MARKAGAAGRAIANAPQANRVVVGEENINVCD